MFFFKGKSVDRKRFSKWSKGRKVSNYLLHYCGRWVSLGFLLESKQGFDTQKNLMWLERKKENIIFEGTFETTEKLGLFFKYVTEPLSQNSL